jgi:YVTN family beta-propeller protein
MMITLVGFAPLANADKLLVLSKARSELAIIDPESLKVAKSVPVGHAPHEVCTSADGKFAFVANYGSTVPGNSISIVDIDAGKELKRVDLGPLRRPHGLAEFAGKIYFTAEHNAAVGRLDPKTYSVDLVVGTGQGGSHMLAVDSRDGRLFTTNIFSGTLSMLNPYGGPGGGVAIEQIKLEGQPEGIALSPDGLELWAGPRNGGAIEIIDTISGKVVHTIDFDGVPIRLSFSPDGSTVFVSDAKSNAIVAFDVKKRTETYRVATKQTPVGHVVSPDGSKLYVSCAADHLVQVIDLESKTVVGEIDAGPVPNGIAYAAPRTATAEKRPGALGVGLVQGQAGVVIDQVMPRSAAEKGGLKTGDRIVKVDGNDVDSPQTFIRRLNRHGAGEEVKLVIERAGQSMDLTITLGERPG